VQFITPQYGDPNGELSFWARGFLDSDGPTRTYDILSGMDPRHPRGLSYRKRHEHGTQHPLDTLQTGSGTCRTMRCSYRGVAGLGIARVSSPAISSFPATARMVMSWRSTHAWVQVYLPRRPAWNRVAIRPTDSIGTQRRSYRVPLWRAIRDSIPSTALSVAD